MRNRRLLRSFWLRSGLGVLAWEIVLIALLWVLHQKVSNFQRFYFSDCLFGLGAMLLMAASVGMLSRPFGMNNSPWGIPALPVQDTEDQRRFLMLAEFIEQRSFAFRLAAIGLLMILVSVGVWYISR